MIALRAAVLGLLCLLAGPMAPVRSETVTFAIRPFPPYVTVVDGKLQGSAVDLINNVARLSGFTAAILELPGKRTTAELLSGALDVSLNAPQPDLADKTLMSDKLTTIGVSVAWRAGTRPVTALSDLADHLLIAIYDYAYLGMRDRIAQIRPPVALIEAYNHREALKLLEIGRAPYFLVYDDPLRALAAQQPFKIESLRLAAADFHFILARNNPRAAPLLDRINTAIRALPPQERFQRAFDETQ
jgi:ABC-type amino acid transport substrate-binding protein